jgi:DNA (cytosine-5)-methyltransferase 1
MNLVLSLFPGIGLLDMAFEEEGFCVVRGPDLLWGGDILRFHPPSGKFDGIIGGPPCQAFSRLRHLVEHNGYKIAENLIPEFERCIREARPSWFVMENVPSAPSARVDGYGVVHRVINNRWFGGDQHRERCICIGALDDRAAAIERALGRECVLLESARWEPSVLANGGQRGEPVAIGGSGKRKIKARELGYKTRTYAAAAAAAQGLPSDFDLPPFTVSAKVKAIGNGVPLPMGRAIASAVRRALVEAGQ